MQKYREYDEAVSYETRPVITKKSIYGKGSFEYSTHRYMQKHTDILLPHTFVEALKHKAKIGVSPELSSAWISTSKFTLWNYVNNTTVEIEFTSPVTHFLVFKPSLNVFTSKITECALVVSQEQIIIYGISTEAKEFVDTGLVAGTPDVVTAVSEKEGNIYLGCENGYVYAVVYQMTGLLSSRSMHLRCLDGNVFSFLLPALFRFKKPCKVISVATGKHWVVVLTREAIKVYSISYSREIKEKEMHTDIVYVTVEISEEVASNVLFYCVSRSGARDFYDTKGLLFSRKPPFTDGDLSHVKVCTGADSVVLCKKVYSGSMVTLIHFNQDQLINTSAGKAVENFEIANIEGLRDIFLAKRRIFIVTERELCMFSIMEPEDFLLLCRPEDTYTFLKSYGERETLVFYYSLVSKNRDCSKLEHIYSKNEALHIPAFYSFVYRILKGVLDKDVDRDFFVEGERISRRIRTVSTKLGLKQKFVSELVETLNFLKICYDYGLAINERLPKIFLENSSIRKDLLDELLSQFGGKIDTVVKVLLAKCPSFIPLNEIYYQKGLECLEKKDLYGSLENFKSMNQGLESIIEKFCDMRFYVGCVTLIRRMECSFEQRMHFLKACVQCRGSLGIALEDFREDFAFCLFEALLSNMRDRYMLDACECCGPDNEPFAKKDFLDISSPFIEPFLSEKAELSLKEEEYALLWKYYILHSMKDEAVASLVRVAENKPMKLEKRIEYLSIASSISTSDELTRRLETARIQKEMLLKKYIPILDNLLLQPSDLLNDYIIPNKCFTLGIKLVDLFDYCDVSLLRKLWSDALQGDLKDNMEFIKKLKIRRAALNFEIIGSILIAKSDQRSPNLINFFIEYGFPKNEVLGFFEKVIKNTEVSHPMHKKKILDILLHSDQRNTEYVKRVASYCQSRYGIK